MKVSILNRASGKICNAAITKVRSKDLDKITSDRFTEFTWQNCSELFKLTKGGVILGLMRLGKLDHVCEKMKILHTIELSIENREANKKYDYIAGCLIAYACLQSMKSGRDLGIDYTKDTKDIYIDNYGLKHFNDCYVKSDKDNSIKLINKYLNIFI